MIGYCDRFSRALCEQAESIRDTCSRDPAQNREDIRIVGKLIFFQKQKMTRCDKKKKSTKHVWLYVQGQGYIYRGYPIGPMQ